jgi:fatty-acyl-CoA synthase
VKSNAFWRFTRAVELPTLQNIVVIGDAPPWAHEWTRLITRAEDVSLERLETIAESVSPTDEAFILFSSGTTSRPKPIVLEHDGLVTNPRSIGSRLGIKDGDRFWLGLPLFFSFAACNESITAFAHGSTLVVQEHFDADEAVALIQEEACSVLYGMGNMFKQMEDSGIDLQEALDSVRVAFVVGPRPVRRRFEEEHGIEQVLHGYGLTEVSAICAITHHKSPKKQRLNTVGHPLANVDIRIKNPETGVEVAPGKEGEICVRSRAMFRKYLKRPNRTRKAIDDEGYLRTGDLGWLDADGRLVFEGRIKDMIKTGGINVSPQEVERVISQHPDVDEVSVVSLPDDEKNEVVGAVVRPVSNRPLTENEIISFCAEQMAGYKVPAAVDIRKGEFPRTDTGKIRKVELREDLVDETER